MRVGRGGGLRSLKVEPLQNNLVKVEVAVEVEVGLEEDVVVDEEEEIHALVLKTQEQGTIVTWIHASDHQARMIGELEN